MVKIEGASETDASEAVKVLASEHGIHSLDIVIANAGISNVWTRIEDIEIKDLREFMEINTFPVVRLFKAVYPLLKKTADEGGKPIFIAVSTEAASIQDLEKNRPYLLGAYGASKIAVNYLVRRAHYENEWLTAFVVNPGFAQTDMGNFGAQKFGFEKAIVPVAESVSGLIKHVSFASPLLLPRTLVLRDVFYSRSTARVARPLQESSCPMMEPRCHFKPSRQSRSTVTAWKAMI